MMLQCAMVPAIGSANLTGTVVVLVMFVKPTVESP